MASNPEESPRKEDEPAKPVREESGPLTPEQRNRLLAHFAEIQRMQKAAGIDNSGPRNRS